MKRQRVRLFTALITAAVVCAAAFSSCSGVTDNPDSNSTGSSSGDGDSLTTTIDTTDFAESVAEDAVSWDDTDVVGSLTFANELSLDFDAMTVSIDGGTAAAITEAGVTPVTGVTVSYSDLAVSVVSSLTDPLRFSLSGTLAKTLTVDCAGEYDLALDGVSITASAGPALYLVSEAKAFVTINDGTENTLADASTRDSSLKKNGAVHAAGPLVIDGTGSLGVTGSYKHGIYSDDYVRIREGLISLTESVRDGIRTINGFIFDDGTLTINATGTTPDEESKGIKVDGDESSSGAGRGWIYINGGTLTITSVSKGITASWDIDEDAATSDTSDDPSPFVVINSGVVTVTTTGDTYEEGDNSSYPDASCSPEGIEGKSSLTINGGYIEVYTDDDCLNAGGSIVINDADYDDNYNTIGTYLYCVAANNDAIDSNGTLTINGGVVVAVGAGQPEGAFDCDQNTFKITGGIMAGIGGSSSSPTASACTQNAIFSYDGLSKGDTFALVNDSGDTVFAFASPGSGESFVFSSPDIVNDTYYLKTGGTLSGTDTFGGLYIGSISSSGGTTERTVTVSSTLTTAGTATSGHGPN